MYIIMRSEGEYVAPPGSAKSYTRDIAKACRFPTREVAERHRCGNETIVTLESRLSQYYGH